MTHDVEYQVNPNGDPVPGEVREDLDLVGAGLEGIDAAKKCEPGGWDLWAWIDGKNFLGETVVRFHTDTEFFYNCKVVTAIPIVTVYGSDYHWFWKWDRTISKEKAGVGTKVGTVVGAGAVHQCMNYGLGDMCTAEVSFKITYHVYANGSFSAVGH